MANVLTSYYRSKPGGFCTRLFRAIETLLNEGHVVHYLSVVPFPIDHPNCHFHRFPWPERQTEGLIFWCCYFLASPFLLAGLGIQYHITHLFAFGHSYALLLKPLALLKNLPLAVFIRGDAVVSHKIKSRSQWIYSLDLLLEGLAIYKINLYGVSHSLIQTVLGRHRWLRPKHFCLLRNDVTPVNSTRERPFVTPIRMACVGILEEVKNQTFLFEVMKEIDKNQAQLFVYGKGPLEIALQEQIKKSRLNDRVFLMGWVEKAILWPQVDLLLMPSLHEGSPNAVMEALSRGLPVLASDIAEHREILPASNLMALDDHSLWVERIRRIAQSPEQEIEKLIADQRPYVDKLIFDWDKYICSYIIQE